MPTHKKNKSKKRSSGVKVHDPSDRKATTRGRTSENRARSARKRPTGVKVHDPSDRKATNRGRTSENKAQPARSRNSRSDVTRVVPSYSGKSVKVHTRSRK